MGHIRISERELINTIKKIINENSDFVTGISASERAELVDDVINRINEFGDEYIIALNKLNYEFQPKRIKRMERPRSMDDVELPKGIKISKSIFPRWKKNNSTY